MKLNLSKLSLTELERAMRQMDRRREALQKQHARDVRAKIDDLLQRAGLTLADVYPRGRGPGRPAGARKAAATKRGARKKTTRGRKGRRGRKTVNPPKYRNPANPAQTWTGHGKRPQWFTDAQKRGKEKDLLIRGAA